jgi:hypothetical protein
VPAARLTLGLSASLPPARSSAAAMAVLFASYLVTPHTWQLHSAATLFTGEWVRAVRSA